MERVRTDSPISADLVAWGNAWLTGHTGLDEAADRLERRAGPQVVTEAPGPDHPPAPGLAPGAETPLRRFLADLRVAGLSALRLALPVAGDPLGLTGPPPFNTAAIDAGQAAIAVLPGRCVGLVPAEDRRGSSYVGVRWTAFAAATAAPDVPSLPEAERALNESIRSATEALSGVGGPAPARPALEPYTECLAPGYPGRAYRVAALAARLTVVLAAAGERGLTAGQIAHGGQALRELDRAVRRARVAAHHALAEPGGRA